jgi:hypothetical protein
MCGYQIFLKFRINHLIEDLVNAMPKFYIDYYEIRQNRFFCNFCELKLLDNIFLHTCDLLDKLKTFLVSLP